MMKIVKYIAVAITLSTVLVMYGCSAVQVADTATTASAIIEIKHDYAMVESVVRSHIDSFSDEEKRTLQDLDAVIDMIITKLDTVSDINALDIHDVDILYYLAKDSYGKAADIVRAHIDDFSSSQRAILKTFDTQVHIASDEIDNLLAQGEVHKALSLIPIVLKIGFKLITMVAL